MMSRALSEPHVSYVRHRGVLQVALIERSKTRHIINLPEILAACNSELTAAGRKPACSALTFDGVHNFPGLLQELQTVDVLVTPLHERLQAPHVQHHTL